MTLNHRGQPYLAYCAVCNRYIRSPISDVRWLWRLRFFRLQHLKHAIVIKGYPPAV